MGADFPVINRTPSPDAPPRPAHVIACGNCPAEDVISAHNGRIPAHTVAAKFRQRGWQVNQKGDHRCPACVQSLASQRRAKTGASSKEPLMPEPKTAPAAVPSRDASSALVDLYMLLQDAYLRDEKAYKAGWSDERIAKECGLSVKVVAVRREQDFGPLVVDTTREDLAREVQDLQAELLRLADAVQAVSEAAQRLDARFLKIKFLASKLAAPAKAA